MPTPTPNHKEQETADRAERIQAAITTLESKIRQIMQEGEVAPKGCYVGSLPSTRTTSSLLVLQVTGDGADFSH
jgi:hypothetical protein